MIWFCDRRRLLFVVCSSLDSFFLIVKSDFTGFWMCFSLVVRGYIYVIYTTHGKIVYLQEKFCCDDKKKKRKMRRRKKKIFFCYFTSWLDGDKATTESSEWDGNFHRNENKFHYGTANWELLYVGRWSEFFFSSLRPWTFFLSRDFRHNSQPKWPSSRLISVWNCRRQPFRASWAEPSGIMMRIHVCKIFWGARHVEISSSKKMDETRKTEWSEIFFAENLEKFVRHGGKFVSSTFNLLLCSD